MERAKERDKKKKKENKKTFFLWLHGKIKLTNIFSQKPGTQAIGNNVSQR